jgi:transposase InsO family protein
MMSIGMLVTTT